MSALPQVTSIRNKPSSFSCASALVQAGPPALEHTRSLVTVSSKPSLRLCLCPVTFGASWPLADPTSIFHYGEVTKHKFSASVPVAPAPLWFLIDKDCVPRILEPLVQHRGEDR